MPSVRLAFLGFGTVGRALHALLDTRRDTIRATHDITYTIAGVASRRRGWIVDAAGLDPERAMERACPDIDAWLDVARPDVVFELTPLEPLTGQPATDYLRAVLEHGAHAISANKGPVVHAFRELSAIAERVGRRYLFESAVMDGAPVFDLARHCLPLAGLRGVRGVFTSTATVVLEAIERGGSIDDGIAHAQRLGIAEADPSYDVDAWDSVMKLCALSAVLFDAPLDPRGVRREGVRSLKPSAIRDAARAGTPCRLVGEIARRATGIEASVTLQRLQPGDPLAAARGTTLAMHYDAGVFPGGLTVTSHDPDPTTTAYGLLVDLIEAVGR